MKIRCFQDADALHIEFKSDAVTEARDLDENTLLDLGRSGHILGITVEHASQRTDIPQFSCEQVTESMVAAASASSRDGHSLFA